MGPLLWLATSAHSCCLSETWLPFACLTVLGPFCSPPPLPRAEMWPLFCLASSLVEPGCHSRGCHLICSRLRIAPLRTSRRRCRGIPPGTGTPRCPAFRPGIPRSQSTTGPASRGTSRTCGRSTRGSRRTSAKPTRTSWGEASCAAQTRCSCIVGAA